MDVWADRNLSLSCYSSIQELQFLLDRFDNELIVAVGKGEPAAVMSDYGFK